MELLQDGAIAALAAIGLAALLRLAAKAFLCPKSAVLPEIAVVVPACGGAGALEQTVRTAERALRGAGCAARIVIVDEGLCPEAKRAAELLCRGGFGRTLCTKETLKKEIGSYDGRTDDDFRHGGDGRFPE